MSTRGHRREEHAPPVAKPGGLGRALLVVELLAAEGPLRFAELEERSALPKATLHRLLAELVEERLASFDERGLTWSTGFRVLELAGRIWTRSELHDLAHGTLQELADRCAETVRLAVLVDAHAVTVDHAHGAHGVRPAVTVGERAPAHLAAEGKALLAACDPARRRAALGRPDFENAPPNATRDAASLGAELERAARRGWAVDDEERAAGVRCIAAAVTDPDGEAVAALSIAAPTFRVDRARLEAWHPELVAAAAAISRRLAPHAGRAP